MPDGEILLEVRANTRSSRSGIQGFSGGKLKVSIHAPSVRGKANAELVEILAREFRVAKSQVSLLRGTASRDKLFRIRGARHRPGYLPCQTER